MLRMTSYYSNTPSRTFLSKIYMWSLALNPLLYWYDISMPIGLGSMILLLLSTISIVQNRFKINVLSPSFLIVLIYVCLTWSYNHEFEIWTFFPPGGWLFFTFVLSLIGGILLFDFNYLKKCMHWIILVAVPLFWIQFLMVQIRGGAYFCFVPHLTDHFTYQGWSYSEMYNVHVNKVNPCSIFIEKSYMAYYLVSYLSIVLFQKNNLTKWFKLEILIIFLTLIMLKSGSGIVGLATILIFKLYMIFRKSGFWNTILMIFLILPLIIVAIQGFLLSETGQDISSRQSEISTEGTSGFVRITNGYLLFSELTRTQQIFGMKLSDAIEQFGWMRSDGTFGLYINGIQTILISLGYVGLVFYLFFYYRLYINSNLSSKMCILSLLVISFLESTYLNPHMLLLTIIPCGCAYRRLSPCGDKYLEKC